MQMDPEASVCNPLDLYHMLIDERAEPRYLRISLLESITNNFANHMVIGSGGFAVVYKGQLQNGNVAVKKLTQTLGVHETKFRQEVECLMSVKHKNIVRFLGYCSDIQEKVWKLNGQSVMAEERQRFLCFEYLPWSLDKYIDDPSGGHEWRTCYQIIKGICEGLHYLHQKKIVHLDLKPANILLDHDLVPKIADFGLSKCFDEKQTHHLTSNIFGTLGYMAPEFHRGRITFKSDMYSLGILIIEILTGNTGCPDIDNVLESWSIRLKMSPGDVQLKPVRVCAEIGIECTDFNPAKRPDTRSILEKLDEMESIYGVINTEVGTTSETNASSSVSDLVGGVSSMDIAAASSPAQQISSITHWPIETSTEESSSISAAPSPLQRITGVFQGPRGTCRKILYDQSSESSKLLDIHPLELRFPWEPNKGIKCLMTLTNRTDRYVGVWITPTCFEESPIILQKRLNPHSTIAAVLAMESRQDPPIDTMFEVLMVAIESEEHLENLLDSSFESEPNIDSEFLRRLEKHGGEVHGAMLKAVICDPASCQTVIHNQRLISAPSGFYYIKFLDVHPTKTWILVSCSARGVSILNYETKKMEMAPLYIKRVGKTPTIDILFGIRQAKFIAQEQWFVVGDSDGWIHVYSYTTEDKVIEFKPYQYGEKKNSLEFTVHPTYPYLLTSETYSIKLWDWSKGWKCTQEFKYNFSEECCLRWSPMDTDTFLSTATDADDGGHVMVWNIHFSDPITVLEGSYEPPCCFYRNGHQNFMVTHDTLYTQVWDMQMKKVVHILRLRDKGPLLNVACHPTLPILVTQAGDFSVCVWDARTYRLVELINNGSEVEYMVLTGTKDSPRLILQRRGWVSVMEINMPTLDAADLHVDGPN